MLFFTDVRPPTTAAEIIVCLIFPPTRTKMPFVVRLPRCLVMVATALEYRRPSLSVRTFHMASEVMALLKALPTQRTSITLRTIIVYQGRVVNEGQGCNIHLGTNGLTLL